MLAIQTANQRSREARPYAAAAWAALDAEGQAAIVAALPDNIERVMSLHNGLAVRVAKHWSGVENSRIEWGDIKATSQLGLLNAVYLFDLTSGNQWSTYAWTACTSHVLRQHYTLTDLAQPEGVTRGAHRVRSATERFEHKHGRRPNKRELADLTDLDAETLDLALGVPEVISADGFDLDEEDGLTPKVELMATPGADELVEADELKRLASITWNEAERDMAPTVEWRP